MHFLHTDASASAAHSSPCPISPRLEKKSVAISREKNVLLRSSLAQYRHTSPTLSFRCPSHAGFVQGTSSRIPHLGHFVGGCAAGGVRGGSGQEAGGRPLMALSDAAHWSRQGTGRAARESRRTHRSRCHGRSARVPRERWRAAGRHRRGWPGSAPLETGSSSGGSHSSGVHVADNSAAPYGLPG